MKKQSAVMLLCVGALLASCGEVDSSSGGADVTKQTTSATTVSETQTEADMGDTTTTEETTTTTTTPKTTTTKATTKKPKKTTTKATTTTTQAVTTTTTAAPVTTTAPPPETTAAMTTTTTVQTTTTTAKTTTKATTTKKVKKTTKATTTAAPETTTAAPKVTTAAETTTTAKTTTAKKQQAPVKEVKAPEKVKGLRVATSEKKTKVSWQAVKGADGYVVWIKRSKDGKWERILETEKTACTLKEPRNKNNSFCVKAYKLNTNSKKVYSEKGTVMNFPYMYKEGGVTYVDGGVLIVNKTYSLPSSYGSGLTGTTLDAFYEMQKAAAGDGISLWICSGFRSYAVQDATYWGYVYRDGSQWSADQYSARAGHSEHQSGLAFDLNFAGMSFNGTREAQWIEKNCYKYGFIVRYPYGKEKITGYNYESWHCRYVGKELAKTLTKQGLTLEEFYGLTSKYS